MLGTDANVSNIKCARLNQRETFFDRSKRGIALLAEMPLGTGGTIPTDPVVFQCHRVDSDWQSNASFREG